MINIIFLIIILGLLAFIIYFINSQNNALKQQLNTNSDNKTLMNWLSQLQNSMENNGTNMEKQLFNQRTSLENSFKQQTQRMDEHTKMIWERLSEAQKVITDINKQIGGIEEFGKDIKDLSSVLKSPKLRGGLGEQFLNELLINALPKDFFKTQYAFKDGSICDAVILTEKGMIPIDSKFSLENFRAMIKASNDDEQKKYKKAFTKDVKKRIDEIANKYIKPDEKTTDYAIMYIPSEMIYYDVIVNTPEVEEYAQNKKVFLTSPNTLLSKLKIFMTVYQQLQLQKHTQEILKALNTIKLEANKFDTDLNVLNKHITNANKSVENVLRNFGKIQNKIENVSNIEIQAKEVKILEENTSI